MPCLPHLPTGCLFALIPHLYWKKKVKVRPSRRSCSQRVLSSPSSPSSTCYALLGDAPPAGEQWKCTSSTQSRVHVAIGWQLGATLHHLGRLAQNIPRFTGRAKRESLSNAHFTGDPTYWIHPPPPPSRAAAAFVRVRPAAAVPLPRLLRMAATSCSIASSSAISARAPETASFSR
jgi:hypothetical protein